MKKITKDYLKFCGVNSIIIGINGYKIYKKLIEDGYEFEKKEKSIQEKIFTICELIIVLLAPIYNFITSMQFILILENNDLYTIIKNRLFSNGIIIEKKENLDNVNGIKRNIDDSGIEEAYRDYRKAIDSLNINNTISEPFKEILNEMKDENNKTKEKK